MIRAGGERNAAEPEPMPRDIAPMLATSSPELPASPRRWAYEFKWDGVRALCYIDHGRLRLVSRNAIDMSARYPELCDEAAALFSEQQLVLDGEIVALDASGRPSFSLLQQRMHVADPRLIQQRRRTTPVVIMVFDVLYAHGRSLLDEPYERRRELLAELEISGDRWQVPPHRVGAGQTMLRAAEQMQLEGIIAKKLGSTYHPGARSRDWLKVKIQMRQEVVIGGFLPMKGMGDQSLGALLVGYYEGDAFRYAGKVGTGFSDAQRDRLLQLLKPDRRATSPFSNKPRYPDAIFVEPRHVIDVTFTEWTRTGALRHPSHKGLRMDKDPRAVVREPG